jgi:hypothetical protein
MIANDDKPEIKLKHILQKFRDKKEAPQAIIGFLNNKHFN